MKQDKKIIKVSALGILTNLLIFKHWAGSGFRQAAWNEHQNVQKWNSNLRVINRHYQKICLGGGE